MNPLRVRVDDRGYRGAWRSGEGVVSVSSAYGARSAVIAEGEPQEMAEGLLAQLVDAWMKSAGRGWLQQ